MHRAMWRVMFTTVYVVVAYDQCTYLPYVFVCCFRFSYGMYPYAHLPYYITFQKPFFIHSHPVPLLLPPFFPLPLLIGERKIVDTDMGAVIVANVEGSFYAVLAKCPHLGLPMKTGEWAGREQKAALVFVPNLLNYVRLGMCVCIVGHPVTWFNVSFHYHKMA